MADMRPIKLRFVIEGEDAIPLDDFSRSISRIEGFLDQCYEETFRRLQGNCKRLEFDKKPPLVTSVGNGCIWLDVLLAVLSIAAPIVCEIIKERWRGKSDTSIVKGDQVAVLYLDPKSIRPKTKRWHESDERLFIDLIIDTYVAKKKNEDIYAFIDRLPTNLQFYGRNSLKCKIRNTKAIFNSLPISLGDTLDCAPLERYSKRHEKFVKEELRKLGFKL